jgi:uncharacterized membrane protein YGL010W
MRTLADWMNEYGDSHQNPRNKRIHWVCVPAILFSVICMLQAISPMLAFVAIIASLVFYSRLSIRLTLGAAAMLTLMWFIAGMLPRPFIAGLLIFAVAWVGQFYGHYIEGKKPSFFKDIQFLLIGPLWLLHQTYRQKGWQI